MNTIRHILGVDPGKKTGMVMLAEDGLIEWYDQIEFDEMPQRLEPAIQQADIVAVEKFTISPRTLTNTRQYEALYVIGMCVYVVDRSPHDIEFALQNPADAKGAFDDDHLHDLDLHGSVRGSHARDALRHALLARRRFLKIG